MGRSERQNYISSVDKPCVCERTDSEVVDLAQFVAAIFRSTTRDLKSNSQPNFSLCLDKLHTRKRKSNG